MTRSAGWDMSTVFGVILGIGILGGAMALGHVPIEAMINPEAILIVFGGTLTAILINFSSRGFAQLSSGLLQAFEQPAQQLDHLVADLADLASYVRKEGILALQPILPNLDDAYLRKGIQYILDNRSGNFIQHALATDIEVNFRNDMDRARVFEAAGGFAPTMGIIGAVIGLVQVAQAFNAPDQLTQGVASAFTATLYGVALSNLFLLPIAGKLKQRAREQWFQKTVLMEGMMSIYQGDHPVVTEEKLTSFIQQADDANAPTQETPRKALPKNSVPGRDEMLSTRNNVKESAGNNSNALDDALANILGNNKLGPDLAEQISMSERPQHNGAYKTGASKPIGLSRGGGLNKRNLQQSNKSRVAGLQSARETNSFKAFQGL